MEGGRGASSATRVTLVASRARDSVVLAGGGRKTMPGGPAHYIGGALRRLNLEYELITGEVAQTEVVSTPHGEEYVIPAIAPIRLPARVDAAALIVSPIVREVSPPDIPEVNGLLVIDLQGFVREPGVSSAEVTTKFELVELFERADVVKASESELERLTDASRRALKSCMLVTTLGERGARVRCAGREEFVPARRVETHYTIGAGDSYLAGFTAALLRGCTPSVAAERAARFTEEFLRARREGVD